jgi:hypothetical protein
MKALYKPLSMVASAAGAMATSALFKRVWRRTTGEAHAPNAIDRRFTVWQVVAAAALQGAIAAAVKAAVDRAGAAGYERATGAWPGDE